MRPFLSFYYYILCAPKLSSVVCEHQAIDASWLDQDNHILADNDLHSLALFASPTDSEAISGIKII